MTAVTQRSVRFGEFELDLRALELRRGGALVKLQQQPARLLAALVARPGELVSREELRRTLWGSDTFVDFDRGLNYCIHQIRLALDDSADEPRFVETLRGRGYRFVGRTDPGTTAEARPPGMSAVRWTLAAVALAALALVGLGVEQARRTAAGEARAIGVAQLVAPEAERLWAEALRVQIVSRLATSSRTPVVDLTAGPERARATRWQLEGRVDRSPQQYRVTMLLRDTRDGSVAWSDVFAGTPGDWVESQSELADRLTEIVRYTLEGESAGLPKRRQHLPDRLRPSR